MLKLIVPPLRLCSSTRAPGAAPHIGTSSSSSIIAAARMSTQQDGRATLSLCDVPQLEEQQRNPSSEWSCRHGSRPAPKNNRIDHLLQVTLNTPFA
jgi:hypothetical protein